MPKTEEFMFRGGFVSNTNLADENFDVESFIVFWIVACPSAA